MLGWNNYRMIERLANIISTISNAPVISLFVFIGLSYYFLKGADFVTVTAVSVCFSVAIPIVIAYTWIKNKNLEMDMPHKEDRIYPLSLVLLFYLIGAIVLYLISAPPIINVLMFCYFSNTLVVLLISLFWKISIHSVGVAGPVAVLVYVFGYPGLIFLLLIPLVMWSRLYLKRHTPYQVIAGAFLGFVLTTTQIYLFLGF